MSVKKYKQGPSGARGGRAVRAPVLPDGGRAEIIDRHFQTAIQEKINN